MLEKWEGKGRFCISSHTRQTAGIRVCDEADSHSECGGQIQKLEK